MMAELEAARRSGVSAATIASSAAATLTHILWSTAPNKGTAGQVFPVPGRAPKGKSNATSRAPSASCCQQGFREAFQRAFQNGAYAALTAPPDWRRNTTSRTRGGSHEPHLCRCRHLRLAHSDRGKLRIRAKHGHKPVRAGFELLSGKALFVGRTSDSGKPLKKHSSDAAGGEAISGHQGRVACTCPDA
jgi:hypothetical protein